MHYLIDLYKSLKQKNYSTLSGAISFFLVVNGGSLIFLLIIIFEYLNFDTRSLTLTEDSFLKTILTYFESNKSIIPTKYYYLIIITSIWSSSTLFFHLIKSGELLYDVERKKSTLLTRIISIFFVFVFIGIMLTSVILLMLGTYFFKNINKNVYIIYLDLVMTVLIPIIINIFFMLFIPPVSVKISQIKKGSKFTITFWFLTSVLFRIFLYFFSNYKAIYGAIAFCIISMIYVYLLVNGLVIGLYINFLEYDKIKQEKIERINNGEENEKNDNFNISDI